jgi:itaconyl-CoA hydratase
MSKKKGWRGRFFEDFETGDVYEQPLGRTVTTTDNLWFTLLTQNTAPIHFDHHYASQTKFGKLVITLEHAILVYKQGHELEIPRPAPEGL